jgi:4'-phosphopantetheinyl transferase
VPKKAEAAFPPDPGADRVQVWIIDGGHAPQHDPSILQKLSPGEQARARRFRSEKHAAQWAFFHAGLREILGYYAGREPLDLEFRIAERDKPSLREAGEPPIHFNLSHSGELALLAITRRAPVGVDIEHMRELNDRDALVQRFFSSAEQAAYGRLPEAGRGRCFYTIWTRKEALIKANGMGLATPLDAFDVSASEAPGWQATDLRAPLPVKNAYPTCALDLPADYTGALALEVEARRSGELPGVELHYYRPKA